MIIAFETALPEHGLTGAPVSVNVTVPKAKSAILGVYVVTGAVASAKVTVPLVVQVVLDVFVDIPFNETTPILEHTCWLPPELAVGVF